MRLQETARREALLAQTGAAPGRRAPGAAVQTTRSRGGGSGSKGERTAETQFAGAEDRAESRQAYRGPRAPRRAVRTEVRTLTKILRAGEAICGRPRRCHEGRAQAMRRRLARHSATRSTPPPMRPRRFIGAACRRLRHRNPCPRAPSPVAPRRAPPALARRPDPYRHRLPRTRPGHAVRLDAGTAAGFPRGRPVALGRLQRRRRSAERRRQAAGRAERPGWPRRRDVRGSEGCRGTLRTGSRWRETARERGRDATSASAGEDRRAARHSDRGCPAPLRVRKQRRPPSTWSQTSALDEGRRRVAQTIAGTRRPMPRPKPRVLALPPTTSSQATVLAAPAQDRHISPARPISRRGPAMTASRARRAPATNPARRPQGREVATWHERGARRGPDRGLTARADRNPHLRLPRSRPFPKFSPGSASKLLITLSDGGSRAEASPPTPWQAAENALRAVDQACAGPGSGVRAP